MCAHFRKILKRKVYYTCLVGSINLLILNIVFPANHWKLKAKFGRMSGFQQLPYQLRECTQLEYYSVTMYNLCVTKVYKDAYVKFCQELVDRICSIIIYILDVSELIPVRYRNRFLSCNSCHARNVLEQYFIMTTYPLPVRYSRIRIICISV